jgi:hypothetical protein
MCQTLVCCGISRRPHGPVSQSEKRYDSLAHAQKRFQVVNGLTKVDK